jgi:hypothetical protein
VPTVRDGVVVITPASVELLSPKKWGLRAGQGRGAFFLEMGAQKK